MREDDFTWWDRVVMRRNNLWWRVRNYVIRALGGYDQTAVGYLVHSSKTLVHDLTVPAQPVPMVAHVHAFRVADAICRLDPELGRMYGLKRAA